MSQSIEAKRGLVGGIHQRESGSAKGGRREKVGAPMDGALLPIPAQRGEGGVGEISEWS